MLGTTLRTMILDGYGIRLYCAGTECGHHADVDLPAMARRLGLDWVSPGPPWPFRCTECGSRANTMSVSPDTRPSGSPDWVADDLARRGVVEGIERERMKTNGRADLN